MCTVGSEPRNNSPLAALRSSSSQSSPAHEVQLSTLLSRCANNRHTFALIGTEVGTTSLVLARIRAVEVVATVLAALGRFRLVRFGLELRLLLRVVIAVALLGIID